MRSGDPKKDKAIGIRLPLETFEKLKELANAERRSVSNYVLLLIERDCESHQTGSVETPNLVYQTLKVAEPAHPYDNLPPATGGKIKKVRVSGSN